MQLGLSTLFEFLDAAEHKQMVLATIISTSGASYRKAGAMMLIDESFESSGLVSGGCLEDDLKAHAREVFASGIAQLVHYDLSQEESASLWGLGLGCGGEIKVLLELISEQTQYGGLSSVRSHWESGASCGLIKIVEHGNPDKIGAFEVSLPGQVISTELGVGRFEMSHHASLFTTDDCRTLAIPVSPANRLLICGAGPDAIPLASLAHQLHWQVAVIDPRPAYANRAFFPNADQLLCKHPDELSDADLAHAQAAVIMTHNVERDAGFLRLLAALPLSYIGLLGPVARRNALLEKTGLMADHRLHGPAGLDIGSILPEEIALAIMAEIHTVISGRKGSFLSSGAALPR